MPPSKILCPAACTLAAWLKRMKSTLMFSCLQPRHARAFCRGLKACSYSWARAETYAHDICGDLLNWAVGWVDWNAFLDVKGGPNWAKNVVDAPIILDTARGDRFFKNPMFYALQHFSAFVPPGSVRIHVESTSSSPLQAPMECVGFRRPDGALAIVVLNRGAQLSATTSYTIELPGKRFVNMDVPPHSFQTLIIPMPR